MKKENSKVETIINSPSIENNEDYNRKNNIKTSNETSSLSNKRINKQKIIIYSLWIPFLIVFTIVFYFLLRKQVLTVKSEVEISLLSSLFILLGFTLNSRYTHFQLRSSKELSTIRSSIYWVRNEYISIILVIMLIMGIILASTNLLIDKKNDLLNSLVIANILTVLFYSLLSFVNTNKFNVYN